MTSTNLLLVLISVTEVSDAIKISFPIDDVRHISQCAGNKIIWEAQYLIPYAQVDDTDGIGSHPLPSTQYPRPHN